MAEAPSRIAVTGSAGFFGRHLVDHLATLPSVEKIVAVDVRQPASTNPSEKIVAITRDVREPMAGLLVEHGIQAMFHLAYVVRPPRDVADARTVNVGATKTLLKDCSAAGVERFIYSSSATVYGAHPGNGRPFTETDEPRPVEGFHYSIDKVAAEKLVERWAKENGRAVAIVYRGCPVMGPDTENFILNTLTMKWLPVPAFSNPTMQFMHIADQTAAFDAALKTEECGIFNIAGAGTVEWRKMIAMFGNRPVPVPARLLQAMTGMTWALRLQDRSPGNGVNFIRYPWTVSIEHVKAKLGWSPRYSSEEALLAAR